MSRVDPATALSTAADDAAVTPRRRRRHLNTRAARTRSASGNCATMQRLRRAGTQSKIFGGSAWTKYDEKFDRRCGVIGTM